MQDKICSKRDDFDLLNARGTNKIYKCFELIGIFEEYQPDLISDDFEKWYIQCEREKAYKYRNIGVMHIYKLLEKEYEGLNHRKYHISKTSMRHFGITYIGQTVKVYEGTYVVLDVMISVIKENPVMWEVYKKYIEREDLDQYLDFQKECMDKYIRTPITSRQNYYDGIRGKLKNLIEKNSK